MSQAWEQVSGVSAAEGSTLEDLNESGLRDELGLEKLWEALATTNRSAIEEEEGLNSAWESLGSLGEEHLDTAWAEGVRAYEVIFFSLSHAHPHSSHMSQPHSSTSHLLYEDALDGAWDGSRVENEYTFRSENPYLGQADDLLQLGTELWERGELQQAILALEAAVQASRAQVAHKSRASLAQVSRTSRTRRAQVAHTSPTHKSHTSLTPVCPPIDHTSFPTPT